jgi:hypothetical protein
MFTPVAPGQKFGLGFAVQSQGNVLEAWHSGVNHGFTSLVTFRSDGSGAAVLVNANGPLAGAIVDSIGEHEIRAIGFQNGKVRIATVSRPKSMIRRAFEPQSLATERISKVAAEANEPVTPPIVDELKADDATEETIIPTPERKKPGRPPKLQTV